ncbi:hypothetical protein ZHAS_00016467 [Anopheles sinensis]|uniref:Uncharacterized protein n=1 Tax=Anopheles sinensis TaxID=74873 RepID=A0A084WE37_ANOSI|nr:hypothetical protein ZHAS_00016467 [Anopheles sinensis]
MCPNTPIERSIEWFHSVCRHHSAEGWRAVPSKSLILVSITPRERQPKRARTKLSLPPNAIANPIFRRCHAPKPDPSGYQLVDNLLNTRPGRGLGGEGLLVGEAGKVAPWS